MALAFSAPNAGKFLGIVELLAKTTDKAEGLKKVLSAALRGAESLIEDLPAAKSPTLVALGGQLETTSRRDVLFAAPIRYGRVRRQGRSGPGVTEPDGVD